MTQPEISALKEKALATKIKTFDVDGVGSHSGRLVYVDEPIELSGEWVAEFESAIVADYFKAVNPQAVLALIERLEKYREALTLATDLLPTPEQHQDGEWREKEQLVYFLERELEAEASA